MSKSSSVYICQQCGYHSPTYLGKCPECDSWNSFVETMEKSRQSSSPSGARSRQTRRKAEIIDLSKIKKRDFERLSSGLEEFDRVLGGGIVPGSLILVSGDPGIGKSTLLTQLALNINNPTTDYRLPPSQTWLPQKAVDGRPKTVDKHEVLYVAGEESARQIKLRVDRIRPDASLSVLNETDVDAIVEAIEGGKGSWGLVIIDSIQTLETGDLESVAGSVGQVRECAHRLQKLAKTMHIPVFLVGHVTKEGNLAGPKTLEHVVDVVLSLEGDPSNIFRILRSTKNRFGPTDEVGIFEMEETGMKEVKNPSRLFLEQKMEAPGSVVAATMSGVRPILVEIQALVTKSFLPIPRRTGLGIDNNRLQLLVAVLTKRLNLPLFDKDIFVLVTGGLKVFEPAVDLAICLSIVSSLGDKVITPKTAVIGEVGLLGELRPVRFLEKRSKEAKKLGFSKIVSSENAKSLAQAVKLALVI